MNEGYALVKRLVNLRAGLDTQAKEKSFASAVDRTPFV
jgi:hypothetical protein